MFDAFNMTYVLNLKERKDRWGYIQKVLKEAGIKEFKRVQGIKRKDGGKGCYLSHIKIMAQIAQDGTVRPLVLEDDAQLFKDWRDILPKALKQLPDDWEILYLGYNIDPHGFDQTKNRGPKIVKPNLVRLLGALTTHAYALRDHTVAQRIKEIIEPRHVKITVGKGHQFPSIDIVYSKLIIPHFVTYGVYPMLFKQSQSRSDIINIAISFPFRQNVKAVLKKCGQI